MSRSAPARTAAGERYVAAMRGFVRHLPFGLSEVVAPTLVGFLLVNTVTFAIDLSLLSALHGLAHWPLPAAITASYATAFALNFALNRVLTFRAHGAVGRQLAVYVAVVIVNYLAWILGVGDALAWAGLDYRLARIAAGACEAAYMYAALRWVVFRPSGRIEG